MRPLIASLPALALAAGACTDDTTGADPQLVLRMSATIPAGAEVEYCRFVTVPETWVTKDTVRFSAGSHHVLVFQTQYESIQVKVTVSGTKISKVEIAALNPKDKKSEQIASGALPKLQQATLAANSADVDTVSGATYTTKSYKESLQSALDQAGL